MAVICKDLRLGTLSKDVAAGLSERLGLTVFTTNSSNMIPPSAGVRYPGRR